MVVFIFLVATFAVHLNYVQLIHMMYFIFKEEFAEKTLGVMGGDEEIEFNIE